MAAIIVMAPVEYLENLVVEEGLHQLPEEATIRRNQWVAPAAAALFGSLSFQMMPLNG